MSMICPNSADDDDRCGKRSERVNRIPSRSSSCGCPNPKVSIRSSDHPFEARGSGAGARVHPHPPATMPSLRMSHPSGIRSVRPGGPRSRHRSITDMTHPIPTDVGAARQGRCGSARVSGNTPLLICLSHFVQNDSPVVGYSRKSFLTEPHIGHSQKKSLFREKNDGMRSISLILPEYREGLGAPRSSP